MNERFAQDVSAAALLFLPFVVLLVGLGGFAPYSEMQLAASDPLVQIVHGMAGLWLVPVLCALPAVGGWLLARPSRATLARSMREAQLAVAILVVGLPLLRWGVGPSLPDFVPPEESARPGIVLGLAAGMLEEAIFRFGVLAPAFVWLRRHVPEAPATGLAILATSLLFALCHELGPGAGSFELRSFVTRFLIPGCVMSLLFLRAGPCFLVTLHSGAHVGIALLFE